MPIKESYEKALRRAVESTPYYQLLKITLEQIDVGFARFRMPFRKELTQIYGVVHGGVIATIGDTAGAFALLTMVKKGEQVTTVEMKINFLSPINSGEIFGEARITHRENWLALGDLEVKDAKGKLLAKGQATYMILSPSNTADEGA
jgi:uncharacterized protein (TIGR00369 family)